MSRNCFSYVPRCYALRTCKYNFFFQNSKKISIFALRKEVFIVNFLDLLIAIPLGYLIFKGYKRGLIFELASLVGVVAGSILAVRLAHWFSDLVGLDGSNALLISFFVLFVAVLVLALLLGKLVEKFVKLIHVGFLNNLAGAVLGMIKGVCIVGVLLYYVAVIDLSERVLSKDIKQASMLYRPVERTGKRLVGKMGQYIEIRKQRHEVMEERG